MWIGSRGFVAAGRTLQWDIALYLSLDVQNRIPTLRSLIQKPYHLVVVFKTKSQKSFESNQFIRRDPIL